VGMKTSLNLVPAQLQRRTLLRQALRRWTLVWGACLVVGTAFCTRYWWQLHEREEKIGRRDNESASVKRLLSHNEQLKTRLQQLQQWREQLRSLEDTQTPLVVLSIISHSAQDAGGRLRIDNLTLNAVSEPPSQEASARRMVIELSGSALDDHAIGQFIASLRAAKLFESVELKATRGTAGTSESERQFRLQCVLRPLSPPPEATTS